MASDLTKEEQDAINRAEWENADNWSGPFLCRIYFSKKDSRVWVPKSIPAFGWTVNLATTAGVIWLFTLLLLPTFCILGTLILTDLLK